MTTVASKEVVASREPVLLCDAEVRAITWRDGGEPLVDLRDVVGLRLDRRLADPRGDYAHLRRGVVRRLLLAQAGLPRGLELLVVEGYRPPTLQRRYFEDYAARLRDDHRDWDPDRRHLEASKFVAPPEVAPHGTGGAVDLTLCTVSGVELDLGTPVNANPEDSRGACYTDAPDISPRARQLRSVLAAALTAAGLVNYPTEWWHWSYGERYWALVHGEAETRYGPVERSGPGAPALTSWPGPPGWLG